MPNYTDVLQAAVERSLRYLHGIHEAEFQAYIEFHLTTVACPTCLANLDDLKAKQAESAPQTRQRRRKIIDSSAGILGKAGDGK